MNPNTNIRTHLNKYWIRFVVLLFTTLTAQAQTVRCTNAAGAVVAYAESATYCPKEGMVSSLEKVSQPTSEQTAQAQKIALANKKQADALESQRLKAERAQANADYKIQKQKNNLDKLCKKHTLALDEARAKLDDLKAASLKHGGQKTKTKAKSKTDKPSSTTTAQRVDDDTQSAKYKKAHRKVALLETKREMQCK